MQKIKQSLLKKWKKFSKTITMILLILGATFGIFIFLPRTPPTGSTASVFTAGAGTTGIVTVYGNATHWGACYLSDTDTEYVASGGSGSEEEEDLYTATASGVPSGSTINSITVYATCRSTSTVTARKAHFYPHLYNSSGDFEGVVHTPSTTYVEYNDVFLGGTYASLATMQIGIKIIGASTAGYPGRCTQVRAVIDYTYAADTTAPNYTLSATPYNTSLAGATAMFGCQWSDDTAPTAAYFQHNNTGTMSNPNATCTLTLISGTTYWANVTLTLNSTAGNTIQYKWNCTDAAGNWNETNYQYLTVTAPPESDNTPPTFSDLSIDNTASGQSTQFNSLWTDNVGLSGWIFGCNNTGTPVNTTWTDYFSSKNATHKWALAAYTLTYGCVVIEWQFWANDTSNNWNTTGIQSFTTTFNVTWSLRELRATSTSNAAFGFDKTWEVNVQAYSTSHPTTGSCAYIFYSFNRAWIDGSTLTWMWSGYNPYGNAAQLWHMKIYDGTYTRSSDSDFQTSLTIKGNGLLQTYNGPNVAGSFGPVTNSVVVSVSSGSQTNVTVFFVLDEPPSGSVGSTMELYYFSLTRSSQIVMSGFLPDLVHLERTTGNNGTYGYSVAGGSTLAIQTLCNSITNWTSDLDTEYMGVGLGQVSMAQFQASVDALSNSSWASILYWYAVLKKNGVSNETTIKRALDNSVMLANGLPETVTDAFLIYDRYTAYGYYWATLYNYETSKWNITTAFTNFNASVYWLYTHSASNLPLWIYGDNTAATGMDRFYDECSETIDMYLEFYQVGVPQALSEAVNFWNHMQYYFTANGTYYGYNYPNGLFECEAGGAEQVAWRLYYFNVSISSIQNMFTDCNTRFLNSLWNSPQWYDYLVVHARFPSGLLSNDQRRLQNTVMAWASILGIYPNMTASSQALVLAMLNGTAYATSTGTNNTLPAWTLLGNNAASLYNVTSNMYRALSTDPSSTNSATSLAANLMFHLGMMDRTTSLAMPLEELSYEYTYQAIDKDLYAIDFTTCSIKVSVMGNGTVTFGLGALSFVYSFSQSGVWNVTFASDWNSILSATRLSDLPTNRYYILTNQPLQCTIAQTNTTISSQPCQFATKFVDSYALAGFIFGTNNTGHWINETWNNDAGLGWGTTQAWGNVTKVLNATAYPCVIQWQVWANDTAGNWTNTGLQNLVVTYETSLTANTYNSFTAMPPDVGRALGEVNASLNADSINWTIITVDYLNGTQWSLIYGTSYNSEYVVTSGSKLWIYCLQVGVWKHVYG